MDSSTAGWQEGYDVPPAHNPPTRFRTGGRGFDMRAFVNRVADQFQDSAGLFVDPAAREALIEPALPHVEGVARDLATGILTTEFLENCVLSVLGRARRIAVDRQLAQITATCVEESMEEDCPYLFWC